MDESNNQKSIRSSLACHIVECGYISGNQDHIEESLRDLDIMERHGFLDDVSILYIDVLRGDDNIECMKTVIAHSVLLNFTDQELDRITSYFDLKLTDGQDIPDANDVPIRQACDVCKLKTVEGVGDICLICGWEDGPVNEHGVSPPNKLNLYEARLNWLSGEKVTQDAIFWQKMFAIVDMR